MYTATGLDSARILKPKLLLQILGGVKKPETEVMDTVFKRRKNADGDKVSRTITTRTVRAVPFVAANNAGVPLYGRTDTADGITVPPMKCHHRIMAADFEKMKNLRGVELRAALTEEMKYVKETIAWNMEWYARHFLATGNCDYPYLLEDNAIADSIVYSLGTMTVVAGPPSVLFDAATATLTDVILHLDLMLQTGKDVANRNHFQDASKTITYARTNVWNAIYDIMDGKQTNNVVTGRREGDVLYVGPYKVKKFDADLVSPVDQSAGVGIPAKKMRMIDLGQSAPHTMAHLEIANTKAQGGQKYVMILPIEDIGGEYIDILVRHRPVGMPIPEAIVDSDAVIS